ncbi:MAG: hypothetical protein K2J39_12365 [Ruminococcus sp.]|nr:hypothetical protein [Ruminococcus sp.]
MAEQKQLGIRADAETTAKFKAVSEQFPNAGECLKALLNSHEIENAKEVLPGQSTSIDDFKSHLDSIATAYIGVLDIVANTENRIRQEFQKQLESKDNIISDLQERIRQAEADAKVSKEQVVKATNEANSRVEQVELEINTLKKDLDDSQKYSLELSETLTSVKSQVADKQQIIDALNQKLTDTEVMLGKAESSEEKALKAVSELNTVKTELSETKTLHEIEVKELKQKYESEVKDLKQQLSSQQKQAEQSIEVAKRLAEADKRESLANQKEQYIAELDELRRKINTLTEANCNLKLQKNLNNF